MLLTSYHCERYTTRYPAHIYGGHYCQFGATYYCWTTNLESLTENFIYKIYEPALPTEAGATISSRVHPTSP